MDRIAQISDQIRQTRLRVMEVGDQPARSGLLKILAQLQLTLEVSRAADGAIAAKHLARAEKLTSIQVTGLLRRILPPRPADATEAAILDRKGDLVRLLDLQPSDDALLEHVVGLAREAALTGDGLTLYSLAGGPLDLYYKARQLDVFRIRRRVVELSGRDDDVLLLDALCGPEGVLALGQELKHALGNPAPAEGIPGAPATPRMDSGASTAPRLRSDLPGAATALGPIGGGDGTAEPPSVDELSPEERRELAEMEQAVRAIATIAGEINAAGAAGSVAEATSPPATPSESRAASPVATPAAPPDVAPPAGRTAREGRDPGRRIRWAIVPLLLLGALSLAAVARLALGSAPLAATVAPPATAVPGVGQVAARSPTLGLEPTRVPALASPSATPVPSPTPVPATVIAETSSPRTSAPASAPSPPAPTLIPTPMSTPIPPTATGVVPPPRVVSTGFGQKGQQGSCAFVVQGGEAGSVAAATRYRVVAYDGTGAALTTQSGSIAAIGPGERLGIAGAFSIPSGRTIARCELQLGPQGPVAASPPTLLTSDVVVAAAPPRVVGVVSNPSPRTAVSVVAYAIAYDASGQKIVGGGMARVGDVAAKSRTTVAVPIVAAAPVEVELYAMAGIPP